MRSSQISLLAALVAPLAFAQNLSGLPTCASGPAFAALGSSGCSVTDIACVCKATAFLESLIPAIQASCTNPSDLEAAGQFAVALCAGAGVTITLPALFSTPAGVPATAPATTPAAAPTTPVAPTSAAPTTTAAPSTSAAPSSASSYTSTSMSSSPSTTSAVAPVSEFTDGQPQATSIVAPVSEFTDGQPQEPTAAPNATTYATPSVTPFPGAAASSGVQLLTMAMLVGTIGAFLAL